MGVHEAAHDDEAEDDLTDNKNVVDAMDIGIIPPGFAIILFSDK